MTIKETIIHTPYSLIKAIVVNERLINQILISSHCDKRQKEGITHQLIIELIQLLNEGDFEPDGPQTEDKEYFKAYPVLQGKRYKLVWWWWLDNSPNFFVRTCHRFRGKVKIDIKGN